VAGGELLVTQTDAYPPGSPTLSGIVMGMTTRGQVPLEGVVVARGVSTGWRSTRTDRNGFYEIHGLIDGSNSVYIAKDGYEKQTTEVVMTGDTRFDIELVEAPAP
jgi:Carboxypeptidase regulatory-like domain